MSSAQVGLKIPLGLRAKIDAHVLDGIPEEVCGFLAGKERIVSEVIAILNVAENRMTSYRMHPQQLVTALIDLEKRNLDLLALYHSHPMGSIATLSATDIAEVTYPDAVHVVAVPSRDRESVTYRAFTIGADQTVSEELVVFV